MSSLHYSSIRLSELDPLAEWDLGKLLALGDSFPAYRYSATFLSTLRTNIQLSTTDLAQNPPIAIPLLHHHSNPSLPSPTGLPMATTIPTTSLSSGGPSPSPYQTEHLPTLHTYPTTTPSDRTSALRLVADSIAQQRQTTSFSLITHPYPLSLTILILGILSQYLDFTVFITTAAGFVMALLVGVRALTGPYLVLAEGINYNWLEGPQSGLNRIIGGKGGRHASGHGGGHHVRSSSTGSNSSTSSASGNVDPAPLSSGNTKSSSTGNSASGGGRRSRNNSNSVNKESANGVDNIVIVTKWGEEEIIGALVMRVLRREKRCVIRAWTVKLKYRGKGVGRGLLEEAVRVAREKGVVVEGKVGFEEGHASECFFVRRVAVGE
ncbi:MAG: hypothetical protein Q9220_002935 [cf. Caloplaca sp. 1 TL-2023]